MHLLAPAIKHFLGHCPLVSLLPQLKHLGHLFALVGKTDLDLFLPRFDLPEGLFECWLAEFRERNHQEFALVFDFLDGLAVDWWAVELLF